jgi:hypothetical protein
MGHGQGAESAEPSAVLPSWNDGPARPAILGFVRLVTAPGDGFVPRAERIAAFDNDGTLWCEKAFYVQADFVLRRLKEMVRQKMLLKLIRYPGGYVRFAAATSLKCYQAGKLVEQCESTGAFEQIFYAREIHEESLEHDTARQ